MKFGAVPVAQAAGAILAHSLRLDGLSLAKGTVLRTEDCDALLAAGVVEVVVARLDVGDVAENAAAERLASALVPAPEAQGLRVAAAGAGRVNLYARGPGLVELDVDAVHRLNAVNPMITLATLPDLMRVDAGTMVATIKIISYAVDTACLLKAQAAAPRALHIRRPYITTASLIETAVHGASPSDKGRRVTAERLARFGVKLLPRVVTEHAEPSLAAALRAASGELVLILTASATSDIADVAPAAVRRAGGRIECFGMPVDPGNLLFFGDIAGRPVVGLPGCARSPALNGADWVLERLICGIWTKACDIQRMGVGGLLKEIPSRPRPRDKRPTANAQPPT